MTVAVWILGLAGAGILLWCLDAWLFRLKERPSDYSARGQASGLGNALLRVQALVDPGAESALEVRDSEEAEREASGDPPEAGTR